MTSEADQANSRLLESDPQNEDDQFQIKTLKSRLNVYKTLGWVPPNERGQKLGELPDSHEIDVKNWLKPVEYQVWSPKRKQWVTKRAPAIKALADSLGLFGDRSLTVKEAIGRSRRLANEARGIDKRFYT